MRSKKKLAVVETPDKFGLEHDGIGGNSSGGFSPESFTSIITALTKKTAQIVEKYREENLSLKREIVSYKNEIAAAKRWRR